MKKTVLWGALFTIIAASAHAEDTAPATNTQPTTTPVTIPASTVEPIQVPTAKDAAQAIINCDYKIAAQTKTVEKPLVLNWSEKATIQAFSFSPAAIDKQINQLQACFTDQGWVGFNS